MAHRQQHRTGEGNLYPCAINSVCPNRIVGYSIDSRMKSRLAVAALNNATARRQIEGGDVACCVIHSDRGSQGEINRSSQHSSISEVFDNGDGGLEQEDQRCARECASAVACTVSGSRPISPVRHLSFEGRKEIALVKAQRSGRRSKQRSARRRRRWCRTTGFAGTCRIGWPGTSADRTPRWSRA